ncbi:MAG: hypothetical protein M3R36_19535, partial [Bacteroidota bacterium]|nr:hypothetical protein [Bacteroidota bacterium]
MNTTIKLALSLLFVSGFLISSLWLDKQGTSANTPTEVIDAKEKSPIGSVINLVITNSESITIIYCVSLLLIIISIFYLFHFCKYRLNPNMIKKILIFILPIVFVFTFGFKPRDEPTRQSNNNGTPYRILSDPNQILVTNSVQLNANQINTWFRNNGNFNSDPTTDNPGFEWPQGQSKFARFSSGIWIGAVVAGDTLICVAEFDYEYLPGYVDNAGNPQGKDDPLYTIYNITPSSTPEELQNWVTNAVPQGAYLDSSGNPLLLGAQTMFYSYTDGYASAHGNRAGSTAPLKAVILQTNWAYSVNGPLSSMSFSEFRIINRSAEPWTKCFIAVWTDDDLGGPLDDAVSVDTTLDLGITYNYDNNDEQYGAAPPAVGFDYFRGPIVPHPDSTVSYYSPPTSNNLVVKEGFRELGVTAFNMYTNGLAGASDPVNYIETYYNLQGIRSNGTQWINPVTNQTTNFAFSGDPVTGQGWNLHDGGDRRFMQCSGPLVVNPGDTQSIVVGQLIARGGNNLKSITELKRADELAQRIFDNNFQVPNSAPVPEVSVYAPGNGRIYLSWNDSSEKITIPNKLSGGTYVFQGYNVYAIRSGTNGTVAADRQLIATYDIKDGIADILDSVYIDQFSNYIYGIVQKGSNNGIARYQIIEKDYITNQLLVSGSPYTLAVTSYFYDSLGGPFSAPRLNESPISSAVFTVIPQSLVPGTEVNLSVGDTIFTDQYDLGVMPIVIDPLSLVNATYRSVFGGTNANPTYTVIKTVGTTSSTILSNIADFTGTQDTAKIIDGFLLVSQIIKDSGVVKDPGDTRTMAIGNSTYSNRKAWTYNPPANQWVEGPDTTAVRTAKLFTNNQFQSVSIGFTFPTQNTFRNAKSKVFANGSYFTPVSATSPVLTGGPARKIKVVFGDSSMAYRYAPATNVLLTDTSLTNTFYKDMVSVPFSVFAIDELDSSAGAQRQLNVAFIDADSSGAWDPDTSKLAKYEITYILASNYSAAADINYTSKNPNSLHPITGFGTIDIMYVWLPRVKKSSNGVPLTFTNGDVLTVSPYRPSRPDFVPGYPVTYGWSIDGTQFGNNALASSELNLIKVFPNPYYGGSSLETDPFDRFIYFSHLPNVCTIYIYTLDGVLVRQI